MDIRHENVDALNAVLTIRVGANDYEEKVAESLRNYRRKAAIKGFRPGNAPVSLINKLYRIPVLVEEINRLVSESMSKYLSENNIKILGEPLPSERQGAISWETQQEFEFLFDLGLMPQFELHLTQKDRIPYYTIKIDPKIRDSYIESLCNQHGEYINAPQAGEKSLIKATLVELDAQGEPRDGGLAVEDASIAITLVDDKEEQGKLIGCTVGDQIPIDTHRAFPSAPGRAALLRVDKEELGRVGPLFRLSITEVKDFRPAEINQALWDKAFGPGAVTTPEEFTAQIDQRIRGTLRGDSEQRFVADMRSKLLEKCRVELPNQFLIRWLTAINEDKYTQEQVERDYGHFEEDLKWQLIRDRIATDQGFEVTQQEVEGYARAFVTLRMQRYGMAQLPDTFLDGYVADLLGKEKERKRFAEGVLENKVVAWVKANVKLDEQELEFEEFKRLMQGEAQ